MNARVLMLSLLGLFCLLPSDLRAEEEARILFIGNSYTNGMRGTFTEMTRQLKGDKVKLEFITKGGWTLRKHFEQAATIAKIKDGKWTHVVLQEQSQAPALGGQYEAAFHNAVKELSKVIKATGAEPVLYMTWGRRDGDKRNARIIPTYEKMQNRLTAAYKKAANDNGCTLVPVGEVWAAVRTADPALGKALYNRDGSHPAAKGAFLISSTFAKVLFKTPTTEIALRKGVTDEEAKATFRAINEVCK